MKRIRSLNLVGISMTMAPPTKPRNIAAASATVPGREGRISTDTLPFFAQHLVFE